MNFNNTAQSYYPKCMLLYNIDIISYHGIDSLKQCCLLLILIVPLIICANSGIGTSNILNLCSSITIAFRCIRFEGNCESQSFDQILQSVVCEV